MKNITVRRSTSSDESALARLAALDSASPPRGPALVAEADSRVLAALPLGSRPRDRGPVRADGRGRRAARAAPRADRGRRTASRAAAPAASAGCSAAASRRPPNEALPTTPPRGSNHPLLRTAPATPSGRRRFASVALGALLRRPAPASAPSTALGVPQRGSAPPPRCRGPGGRSPPGGPARPPSPRARAPASPRAPRARRRRARLPDSSTCW